MSPTDIIRKKRDGGVLGSDEIHAFIRGYLDGQVTDYHMAALLMAVYFNGMTPGEIFALTREVRDSGRPLDLSTLPGKKVDKHSTGGVGDKTSLVITPIAAACGVTVPMITGRALGHTGGTLDKLQSIPGFNPYPSPAQVLAMLRQAGAVIMGQTDELAPADRRMYALRDVTASVESIPLITASILGKKLAEGIDGLVMDIKAGSGSFMPTLKSATMLARSIVDVCGKMKTEIVVLITDMSQPLGRAIGNALEIRECVEFLHGSSPKDLEELSIALSAQMIRLGGRARSLAQARRMAYSAVNSGEAAKRFREIIELQQGDARIIDDPSILPTASHVQPLHATAAGFVSRCDAKLLGLASNALGAGRQRVDDVIDPAVGIYLEKKVGDRIARGETLCQIHWNDERRLKEALPLIRQAYEIRPRRTRQQPLVHAVLGN